MTKQEFIKKFIDINQPMEVEPFRFSTVSMLLRGARKLSGRNLLSGAYTRGEFNEENFKDQTYHSNQLTGLINYLIFLEQVGTIFKFTSKKLNGIHITLENFSALSELSEKQIFAIRALRNSLTHNYGLATEITKKNIKRRHKFTLSIERNKEIIKIPLIPWQGDFADKNNQTNTIVYVIDLCDLAESIYSKLKEEIENNNVEIGLLGGLNELKARFTTVY